MNTVNDMCSIIVDVGMFMHNEIDMNKSRRAKIKDVSIGARFGCMSDDYGVICIG